MDFYADRRAKFAAMMAEGKTRAEVRELLDLTSSQYDSMKAKLRRRLEREAA